MIFTTSLLRIAVEGLGKEFSQLGVKLGFRGNFLKGGAELFDNGGIRPLGELHFVKFSIDHLISLLDKGGNVRDRRIPLRGTNTQSYKIAVRDIILDVDVINDQKIDLLAHKGGGSVGSQDNVIFVPLTTARVRLLDRERDHVDIVYIQAVDAESVTIASNEVAQILRTRHHTEIGLDDFTIFTQQDFVATAETITGVLTIFLGGIAAISLLVGGIGIMNIMLVSVTERTREIGLRKAIGARKKDILIQFLTESSLLSLFGGVIGIGLGWLIGFIVGKIADASGSPFTPSFDLSAILLATIFSTAVGLFFGIYPANRAANLEPVEALRYE